MVAIGKTTAASGGNLAWPSLAGARIVVTGAAGFIGRALLHSLSLCRADAVVAVDVRSLAGAAAEWYTDCELVCCERSVLQPLDDVLGGVDVVFHLAAQVGISDSIRDPREDAETNVQGTVTLLESCRRMNVRRIVYSSSAAVYGSPVYLPVDEQHPTQPRSPYGLSKLTAERYCLLYRELFNISVVALRYFNVYGPNQTSTSYTAVIPLFLDRVARSLPLVVDGDGYQTRDFVHVQDVVRANLLAATSQFRGVLNVGSGHGTSIRDVATLIGGEGYPIEYGPPRPGDIPYSVAAIGAAYAGIGYTPSVSLAHGLAALKGA